MTDADRSVLRWFDRTLTYARERSYRGWDYGDGMSSQLLQALPVDNKWVNLAVQETVKRAPLNVRPLFAVEQRRNYKGTALFVMANLTAARLRADDAVDLGGTGAVDYRGEARRLAEWLVDERREGYSGFCGGHNHPIQFLHGQGQPEDPDAVSTTYAVKALLRARVLDESYGEIARTAADFLVEDLDYRPVEGGRGAVIDYHLNQSDDHYTINAGALCARTFVDIYDAFGDEEHRRRATELLDHIADLQTARGGWYYRDPPSASHLSMDSHHNGFVIECFQRYRAVTGSDRYEETLSDALSFYRRELFEPDGAPNFDEKNAYPRDIHASTQGALVFTYAGEHEFARRILEWVFENLHAGNGAFYYRKERFFTRRVTLMRWCQAWMAYAMAEYLDARRTAADTDR
jgi:hypothetical protein